MLNNLHPIMAQALAPFMFHTDPRDDLLLEEDDTPEDDEQDDEPGICPACSGSGEGQNEGSTCTRCKGMGEVWA